MSEETPIIPGITSSPVQTSEDSSGELGLVYTVPGNSTAFDWKLAPGASGILWSETNYSVLPDCSSIVFDDIAIELGADGETRTVFHGDDIFEAPQSVAVDFTKFDEALELDEREEEVELDDQIIPNQLDEMGAEISFDVGSFLTNSMMEGGCSLQLFGMPSGLVYNAARMRVEGIIADDATTGQPHHVSILIRMGNRKVLKSSFTWTVRDVKAVDQGALNTMVVPSLHNTDDASSAAVLFSVATSVGLASRGFSLAKSANDLEGAGRTQVAQANPSYDIKPLQGAKGEAFLSGGENDDLINLDTGAIAPITRDDDEDENLLPDDVFTPSAEAGRGREEKAPEAPEQQSLSADDVEGSEDSGSIASAGTGPDNSAPFASPPPLKSAFEETLLTNIDVLSYAFDLDNDALNVVEASAQNGIVEILDDGTLSYLPDDLFNGIDTVSFVIDDGNGGQANSSFDIDVLPVNDLPVLGSIPAQTTNEDVVLNNIDVLSSASDVDGDTLLVLAGSTSATNGSVSINGDGTLNYTPNTDYFGSDTISYTVDDGNGGTVAGSFAVTVNSINDAPVAGSPTDVSTNEDTALNNIDVLSAASDVDGDTLTVLAGSASATNGSVTINGDGTLNYTPNADYFGSDTISYTVDDGNGGTVAGSVAVTVNSINDAPVAGSPAVVSTNEDTALNNIDVLSAASDVDGDTLTVLAGSASATNGAVTINGDGTLNYIPNADYFGSDTISYTVDDG
ncbi:MAG: Ig-like domain-containing protein, partial [Rhizobiaceae bacterium]